MSKFLHNDNNNNAKAIAIPSGFSGDNQCERIHSSLNTYHNDLDKNFVENYMGLKTILCGVQVKENLEKHG